MPQIVFIADDAVHPVNSGGRLELRGELRALASAGAAVHLVVFHREAICEDDRRRTAALADSVHFVARTPFVRTTLRRPAAPFQLASRALPRAVAAAVVRASGGRVDAIVASHEWTIPAAQRLSLALERAPILLRSHNDERAYYRSLAEHAGGLKRLYLRAETLRIRGALRQRRLWRGVAAIAVISSSDGDAYARTGLPVEVVPPTFDFEVGRERLEPLAERTICFVGALDSSHTEDGLRWFLRHVFGALRRQDPEVRLIVAGRRAGRPLRDLLDATAGVEFVGEVEEPADVYDRSRIFVNPVFSGSGVNMKVGPPLAYGLPVITTSFGARGLPSLLPALVVADDAATMRARIAALLRDDELCAEVASIGSRALHPHRPEETGVAFAALLAKLRSPV